MPYQGDVLPILAKGFTDKAAIKVLMGSDNEFVRWRLATNPHLDSAEIDCLFEIGSNYTRLVIAARYDLTDEQLIRIVKCRSDEMLIAIMVKSIEWKSAHKLSNEVASAITEQKRFDPSSPLAFELGSRVRDDFPDKDLLSNEAPSVTRSHSSAKVFEFMSLTRKVDDILQFADFTQYAAAAESEGSAGASTSADSLDGQRDLLALSVAALVEMDNRYLEVEQAQGVEQEQGVYTSLATRVCSAIQTAAGSNCGEEFFSILLPLLEYWSNDLTLGDAVSTTLTLMESLSHTP